MTDSPATICERHWPAILRLIEGGSTLETACAASPAGPKEHQVRYWLRSNPDGRAALRAARTARRDTVGLTSPAAWEAGLRFYADPAVKVTTKPPAGTASFHAMRLRAHRDFAFAKRLQAMLAPSGRVVRKNDGYSTADDYASAVQHAHTAAITKSAAAINRDLRAQRLPTLRAMRMAKRRHAWVGDGLDRFKVLKYGRATRRHGADAFTKALALVSKHGAWQASLLLRKQNLPRLCSLYHRAASDDAIRHILDAARLRMRNERLMQRGELLRSELMTDDLYREASKLFARGLPADLRDDMISEVVVAVLDGEIGRDEIAAKGSAIGWRFVHGQKRSRFDTLDRPAFRDAGVNVVDLLSTSDWSFEGAI